MCRTVWMMAGGSLILTAPPAPCCTVESLLCVNKPLQELMYAGERMASGRLLFTFKHGHPKKVTEDMGWSS